jgi:hypothetical protein
MHEQWHIRHEGTLKMSNEEQGTLLTLDPDERSGRPARSSTSRAATSRHAEPAWAAMPVIDGAATAPAEATLSLEPLRVPITAMVQGTLRAEREVLERIETDLRAELERLRECRVREEAMGIGQTDLYRRAAEEWEAAGRQAALKASSANLLSATRELQAAVGEAGARFWRRTMLAAWLVALSGLGLIGGLCGVVWLALAQR